MVTRAEGMSAPEGSCTSPVISPEPSWARVSPGTSNGRRITLTSLRKNDSFGRFIPSSYIQRIQPLGQCDSIRFQVKKQQIPRCVRDNSRWVKGDNVVAIIKS